MDNSELANSGITKIMEDLGFDICVLIKSDKNTMTPITKAENVDQLIKQMLRARDSIQAFVDDITTKVKGQN